MDEGHGAPRSVRGFKILTIVGCLGTLVFLWLEAYRENFAGDYRRWQTRYAERLEPRFRGAFEIGIKQAFVPDLDRVDRCQSCHVAIDDPAQGDAPQPLRAHSRDILAAHPPDEFGCTICHQGQGRAVSLPDAHGNVPHWEEPLLVGELVYTTCGTCHSETALFGHEAEVFRAPRPGSEILASDLASHVPGAELLARGKELVATSGCLGCHAYRGRGGTAGPDLTHVGDKGVHGYDFSHLPPGVERTPLQWLKAHFMDPGAVSPGTVMPGIGTGERDAEALAAYMLSLRSQDVPARYRPAPDPRDGRPADGRQLYELFCVACHGRDLAGSGVPEIRTPSLSNEDFLAVADDAFLAHLIEHGRSETEMPAWGLHGGGLDDAQIARLVGYIRSHELVDADPAQVASLRGDPVAGRAVYRGRCASCHGVDGEGGLGTRLRSADFLSLVSDEFLIHTVVEGRPGTGMPGWRNLSSQAVADVVTFLRSWEGEPILVADVLAYLSRGGAHGGTNGVAPSEEGGPDTAMGARLFAARCAACHGARGQGAIGPSLDHPDFLAIASDAYLAYAIVEGRPGTAMPAWRDLSHRDVGDLISHLRTLSDVEYRQPRDPVRQGDPHAGQLLFGRMCASCHGLDAVGGMGPQLRNPVFLAHASDGFLFETVARGRFGTPMRGFLRRSEEGSGHALAGGIAELSSSQVLDIVSWLRSLEHAGPTEAWRHPALGSASRGRELYEDVAACAKCHGYEGQGGVGPAIGNASFLERSSEGYLLGTMVLGRAGTGMRDFVRNGVVSLSAEQLMDVAAYVRTLAEEYPSGRAGWRRWEATRDRIAVGGEFYAYYCAACHGEAGRGGYAPELNNPEFLAAASDGFLVATIARGRIGTPMRPFGPGPSSLAVLSDEEIQNIIAYIRSWESGPPSGTED